MKFTNGYWMTKPEYRMDFAAQCVRAEKAAGGLRLLAACRKLEGHANKELAGHADRIEKLAARVERDI